MTLQGSIRRALARTVGPGAVGLLLAVGLGLGGPGVAQDAADEPEAPAASEGTGKPRPKPRPVPAKPAKPPTKPEAKPAAAPVAPAGVWPTGASALSETYGDWTLNCARSEAQAAPPVAAQVSCLVTQAQGNKQTGRREFAIELRTPREGRAEGVILMPFGLSIEPGVTFKLDEAVLGKGAPYTSCTGEGCLVPISFPTLATDAMKTAKALAVIGQKAGGTDPVTLSVPLTGFVTAFERAIALTG